MTFLEIIDNFGVNISGCLRGAFAKDLPNSPHPPKSSNSFPLGPHFNEIKKNLTQLQIIGQLKKRIPL